MQEWEFLWIASDDASGLDISPKGQEIYPAGIPLFEHPAMFGAQTLCNSLQRLCLTADSARAMPWPFGRLFAMCALCVTAPQRIYVRIHSCWLETWGYRAYGQKNTCLLFDTGYELLRGDLQEARRRLYDEYLQ
jgi:hypothetical protein